MSVISLEREAATSLVRRYGLTPADLVLEIGIRVLGAEPDMWAMAQAWNAGVDTLAVHFTAGAAEYIREKYGLVKLLVARNVKPGTEEFAALVAASSRCLAADGAIAILGAGANAVVEVRPDVPARRAA